MVDTSGFSMGNFIKADEVKAATKKGLMFIVKITSEPIIVKKVYEGKENQRLECDVATQDNTERQVSFNATSVRTLADAWGAESKNWVGRKVILNTMMTSIGKEGIFANPYGEEKVTIK